MPELYVGNVSKQIVQFCYRFPERTGVIVQTIPIGGQIRITPNGQYVDLSPPEIDSVISQHRTYGIVSVDDIDEKRGAFDGLCYSVGKAISIEKLRRAMHKKDEALQVFGQKIRQEAALAVNSQIEEQVGAPLRQLEMSFQEEEPRGGYVDDLDHLAEGVRVTRTENVAPLEGRRSRR